MIVSRPITNIDLLTAQLVAISGEWVGIGQTASQLPVRDYFFPGLYLREIFMPAGFIVVSKRHKTEHPFIVSQGVVRVYDELDGQPVEIHAPYQGRTLPGTKRVLYTLDDTVWTTIHLNPDNLRDIAELERGLIIPDDNPLLTNMIPTGSPTRSAQ